MKAIVAGATGAIGHQLIERLLSHSDFTSVTAITRRPLKIEHSKFKECIISNLSEIASEGFLMDTGEGSSSSTGDADTNANAFVVFCCLGTTIKNAGNRTNFRKVDYEGVAYLKQMAEKNKIKKFILVSAAGANPNSVIFYNKIKGETENLLIQSQLEKVIIFRPGLLLTARTERRQGEALAIKFVEGLSQVLPSKFLKPIATNVQSLIVHMISEALSTNAQSRVIIEAKDIGLRGFA